MIIQTRYVDPVLHTGSPPLARFEYVDVPAGQLYWRLISAKWRADEGTHHIYVDVWGEDGTRLVGIPVRFWWGDGQYVTDTEAKPGEPQAANMPMYASGASYSVAVTGLPSDVVTGMGMGTPDARHTGHHTSYRLIFQRTRAGSGDGDDDYDPGVPVEPPPPDGEWRDDVQTALMQIRQAERTLERLLNDGNAG